MVFVLTRRWVIRIFTCKRITTCINESSNTGLIHSCPRYWPPTTSIGRMFGLSVSGNWTTISKCIRPVI